MSAARVLSRPEPEHGTNKPGPTARQRQVLALIARADQPPTMSEMAERLGVSVPAVSDLIAALERKGCVERNQHTPRSLRVTDRGLGFLGVDRGTCKACGSEVLR
jgi:Mn-dependent DtxR family transcriptional regulator